jgi:hypothetical protein
MNTVPRLATLRVIRDSLTLITAALVIVGAASRP